MPINLHEELNQFLHPDGVRVYAENFITNHEVADQTEQGMVEPFSEELLAPFCVSSFINNDKYYMQVANICERTDKATLTQFCSLIPKSEHILPQSLLQACDYVEAVFPEHSSLLKNSLQAAFAVDFYSKFDDCLVSCWIKANLRYQLTKI
jgi:hypothetical protein